MSLDAKRRKLARRLAEMTHEAGLSRAGEVREALEKLLEGEPLSTRRHFVRTYLNYLKRVIAAHQVRIQHAGPLAPEAAQAIAAHFSTSGQKLEVLTEELPELIGGLRVIHGDDVYDSSLAGRLQSLQSRVL